MGKCLVKPHVFWLFPGDVSECSHVVQWQRRTSCKSLAEWSVTSAIEQLEIECKLGSRWCACRIRWRRRWHRSWCWARSGHASQFVADIDRHYNSHECRLWVRIGWHELVAALAGYRTKSPRERQEWSQLRAHCSRGSALTREKLAHRTSQHR